MVDHTFALVAQHWDGLSSALQMKTHDTISEMVKTHSNVIREKLMTIPSLASIPLMSKIGLEIQRLKKDERPEVHLRAFAKRLHDENVAIVTQGLRELVPWLGENQGFVHEAAVSEQPKAAIADLMRALLDVCTKYADHDATVVDLSAQCIGIVGCLDPNNVDMSSSKRQVLVLSNFEKATEVINWVAIMLEDVLVPAFRSSTNARDQGFLAYVMQELVRFCGFNEAATARLRPSQAGPAHNRWAEMTESVRNTLTPFLSSRYLLNSNSSVQPGKRTYPVFAIEKRHSTWLREWAYDMMWRGKGDNAEMVFPILARIINRHDISIAGFLLPYVALNIVLGGTVQEAKDVGIEMLTVLSTESFVESEKEALRQCSENVFAVLDYMSKWLQEKKRTMAAYRTAALRAGHPPSELEEVKDVGQIESVESVIRSIPADIIAQRAMECGSYARALFHWESYIRSESQRQTNQNAEEHDAMFQRLHSIYSQIDEPDGLDGISAHLNILSPEQQAFQHQRTGRWSAAQSWYEFELVKEPSNASRQTDLLSCLRESGQYDQVLRYASFYNGNSGHGGNSTLLSYITEACWTTERFDTLKDTLSDLSEESQTDFNVGVARVLLAMQEKNQDVVSTMINKLRNSVAKGITSVSGSSLQACHDVLLKLHIVYEIGALSGTTHVPAAQDSAATSILAVMDKRLAVVGSYISDKQYLLGIRRAVMRLSSVDFSKVSIGSSWLTTARLARKTNVSTVAHYAVLNAFSCGDDAAKIEHARLLWKDDQHRQAIRSLEGAIASNTFATYDQKAVETSNPEEAQQKQNMLSARAHLLLAKWLDASGQTQATKVVGKYQYAARHYSRWEKGHYYLGKHYNMLLDASKTLPVHKQSDPFISGELTKLVIENYLRSVPFGSKYWYQTIPKIITLWLDLGMDCIQKTRNDAQSEVITKRSTWLDAIHKQMKKYFDRIPPYIFYNALPQMISRITHPNPKVYDVLSTIIQKIVSAHPSQALWFLLAVCKASVPDRASRGVAIINKLKDPKNRPKNESAGLDLRVMITHGQKLSDGLLQACEIHIETRSANVSLSKDLNFNHKLAPNPLVIPLESTLTANAPVVQDAFHIRKFVAFAQERITIQSFSDEVLVLNSLQRPRKLTVRGSDGKQYGLLCKPKDDLRKDQRLMEFNTMINRALKRDTESSKRRLYIKTYGVTPLSEESGTIEWVEGIKPLRDILLKLYQRKGVQPNYNELRVFLSEASANPANVDIFTEKVLKVFPSILHEWFAEMFPEPDSWFAARLRYARSAAVMSMVGHVLGLGDRHGENILLQEDTGGVFHVDFNCLFDKGLTFEKPELVPFRLTHNMIAAMGAYGYEGPFRKSAELTLGLLRQHQDTLMNILETFLHDPTTDFIGKKKRTTVGVPETPQEVLDSVSGKLKGFLRGETVPLSVEGHVNALIGQATDPWNLCQMYIGWCAFL
jgi:serine/threonine-protein kinase ATR